MVEGCGMQRAAVDAGLERATAMGFHWATLFDVDERLVLLEDATIHVRFTLSPCL